MESLLPVALFICTVALIACVANVAVWSHRGIKVRALAVALVALLAPLLYLSVTELLSRPKPARHAWFLQQAAEAIVLGAEYVEGEAIYLWLRVDGAEAPGYFVLPWNDRFAERLEDLLDEGLNNGTLVRITNPFSRKSFEDLGDMNMDIVEPPSLPLKLPPQPPESVNPREQEA